MPMSLEGLKDVRIPLAVGSVARWSRTTPKACVIFIHGYGGHATKTWGESASSAAFRPEFATTDLIFAGYESKVASAAYSMGVLYRLVEGFANRPGELSRQTGGPDRNDYRYDRIVLVGHSLGAALARDVAMTAARQGLSWANDLRLALFAPAHLGANIITLAHGAFGLMRGAGLLEAALILASPVLADLKEGSGYLAGLLGAAKTIGPHCTTQPVFVVHAQYDRIVVTNRFFEDPPLLPYPHRDHVNCCKVAQPAFMAPLNDVAGALHGL